jgi:hypothetical protein
VAVEKVPLSTALRIRVQTGVDPENGNPILRIRNYSRVKPAAGAADVYAVAEGLAGLQVYPHDVIQLNEQSQLMES